MGSSVLNSVKNKRERIGRMLEMNANDRTDIEEARAGDIIALVGCKDTTTGETLCDPAAPVILEKMDFPEPVIKGMGELRLEIICDRMMREFKVECTIGAPQVAYREAISKPATVEYTHKKQSGG